jgi:O-antigen/teichoic acid export membrane protein
VTRDDHSARVTSPPSWARGWLSDSSNLLASQVLTVIATSVAAIMIARTLDPGDWGVFSAFLGLSIALALVADFGLGTWLLRELSRLVAGGADEQGSERAGRLLSAGIVVNTVVALPLLVAALAWSAIAQPGADVTVALVSLLVYGALTATANVLETHLRAHRRVRLVLAASLIEKGVLLVLLVAVVTSNAGLAAIGISYVVAGLSRIAFDATVVFVRDGVPHAIPATNEVRDVARASLPFALNAASFNLVPRLDTLVLLTLSATSAGWFAIGDRVLGPALLVPATLGATLYPFMAGRAAKEVPPWKLAGAVGAAGVVLAAVGILLAPFLIPLLFGDAYEESVPVAQIMLLVVPLIYTASPLLVIAYSHGRERSLLVPILALSLAGTVAIVVGQMVGGPTLAAAGYVARSALFLAVIGVVAFVAWRRHTASTTADEVASPGQVSAQAQ